MNYQESYLTPKVKLIYTKKPNMKLITIAMTFLNNSQNKCNTTNSKVTLIKRKCKKSILTGKEYTTREIFKVEVDEEKYYLKKFSPAVKEKLKLKELRGLKCFITSNELISRGIIVPEPMFALIHHKESIFVYKHFDGVTLPQLMESDLPIKEKKEVLTNFTTILGTFLNYGFVQSDMHPGNFLIDDHHRVIFIDVESISRKRALKIFKSVAKVCALTFCFLINLRLDSNEMFMLCINNILNKLSNYHTLLNFKIVLVYIRRKMQINMIDSAKRNKIDNGNLKEFFRYWKFNLS